MSSRTSPSGVVGRVLLVTSALTRIEKDSVGIRRDLNVHVSPRTAILHTVTVK